MEYVLHRKSNCKKIKIRVIKGVVQVSAPFYVSKREIDDFVKEQETWIKNQLSKYTVSKENDKIPLLGNEYRLHYIDQRKCYVEDYDLYLYPDAEALKLEKSCPGFIETRNSMLSIPLFDGFFSIQEIIKRAFSNIKSLQCSITFDSS